MVNKKNEKENRENEKEIERRTSLTHDTSKRKRERENEKKFRTFLVSGTWWVVSMGSIRSRESVKEIARSAVVAGPEFVEVFRRE